MISSRTAGADAGFTLIEIMVVLIIIGVMTAMVTLSIGDNRGQEVERQAQRLQALLKLAAEESIIRAQPLGIDVSADAYRFLAYEPDAQPTWQPMTGDREFRRRRMPDFIRLSILADGAERTVKGLSSSDTGNDGERDHDSESLPQALLLPSGELTPFRIVVRGSELHTYWLVEGHLDGRITVQAED